MSNRKIAIIGTGISGLTLAYALAQNGSFDIVVFSAKDAEEIRNGRLPSTQVHFSRLLDIEGKYGMSGYGDVHEVKGISLIVGGQQAFTGYLNSRAVSVDQRQYLSALIEGLAERRIPFVKRRIRTEDLPALAGDFDLVIDCTGKIGPVVSFPVSRDVPNAPSAPMRVSSAGIFRGIDWKEDHTMSYNIIPGLGELFEVTTMTRHGLARQLLLEAVPGSELDRIRGDKGPEDFAAQMKEILRAYLPHIHDRVDHGSFRLVDDKAYLRMAIMPEVRIPYTTIGNKLVLGCGDSVVLNDPITGQGANCASYCADVLYVTIAEHGDEDWDPAFGERYWQRIHKYVTRMSEWTNAMMGPPSASFGAMMAHASENQATADEIVNLFTDPVRAHAAFFAE